MVLLLKTYLLVLLIVIAAAGGDRYNWSWARQYPTTVPSSTASTVTNTTTVAAAPIGEHYGHYSLPLSIWSWARQYPTTVASSTASTVTNTTTAAALIVCRQTRDTSCIGNTRIGDTGTLYCYYSLIAPDTRHRWVISGPNSTRIQLTFLTSMPCQDEKVIIRAAEFETDRLPPICGHLNKRDVTICSSAKVEPSTMIILNSSVAVIDFCSTDVTWIDHHLFKLSWNITDINATTTTVPCFNGQLIGGSCHCNFGFGGASCSVPCVHGTVDRKGRCICWPKFTGDACENHEPQCLNGGKHRNGGCVCPHNYEGIYCGIPKCNNGWLTNTRDGSWTCACPGNYFGRFCEGKCVYGWWNDESCRCFSGYTGSACEHRSNVIQEAITDDTMATWSILAGLFLIFLLIGMLVLCLLIRRRQRQRRDQFRRAIVEEFRSNRLRSLSPMTSSATMLDGGEQFGFQSEMTAAYPPPFVPVAPPPAYDDALKLPLYSAPGYPTVPGFRNPVNTGDPHLTPSAPPARTAES